MLGATLHAPSRENRIKLDIRARGIEIEICFFSSLFLQKKKKEVRWKASTRSRGKYRTSSAYPPPRVRATPLSFGRTETQVQSASLERSASDARAFRERREREDLSPRISRGVQRTVSFAFQEARRPRYSECVNRGPKLNSRRIGCVRTNAEHVDDDDDDNDDR